MALDEAAAAEQRRAAAEREAYGALRFRPELNPRSQQLARERGGVEALVQDAEQRQQRLEELRSADTSKPRVLGFWGEEHPAPQPAAKLSIAEVARQGYEGLTEQIQEQAREREARAAAAREEEEARRMRECTFAPEVMRHRPPQPQVRHALAPARASRCLCIEVPPSYCLAGRAAQGPVVVKGLDRHLELRQLADRRQVEAAERAARVFLEHPRTTSPGHRATVPRPFKLEGQQQLEARATKKQAAAVAAAREALRECTFQPQTNAGARRVVLQRLLLSPPRAAAATATDAALLAVVP